MRGSRWRRPLIKSLKVAEHSSKGPIIRQAGAEMEGGIYGCMGLGGHSALCSTRGWGLRGSGGSGGWKEGVVGVGWGGRGGCRGEARADSPEWLCSCHSKGENLNERVADKLNCK